MQRMWKVATTDEYDEWFDSQDHDTAIEVIGVVNLLSQYGPRLARPHADTLKGSHYAHMKELRVRTASSEIRVAFAFDPQRQGRAAYCWR